MDTQQIISELTKKFQSAENHFNQEIKKIRTGRASADMLDSVIVEAYGTRMPLNQVASTAVVDAKLIQITPFDPNNLKAITVAVRDNNDLRLNPIDDGHVVRVPIPSLTEELSENDHLRLEKQIDDIMNQSKNRIDEQTRLKESEILTL